MPVPEPVPPPEPPTPPVEPVAPEPPVTPPEPPQTTTGIRVHVLSTRNTYVPLKFDVFAVATKQLVSSGAGAIESSGEVPPLIELAPGLYKIVRSGEPFEARVDFAVVTVIDAVTDIVIVVDPDSLAFRGSGPLAGELPTGIKIAGVRLSLNGGGTVLFNQVRGAVGSTSGTTSQFGVFGNFGLVLDKGVHFVDVNAQLRLDLVDPITGSITPTHDRFEASGLYSYKLNNPYVGPYVRAAMRTRIFPGYLYLQRDSAVGMVTINRLDGTTDNFVFGSQANPDDLRIRVAKAFAPLRLQEELGANLKAVDLDLVLIKLNVGTRIGFGFRQGFTNGLLVADSSEKADPVVLREVDDYSTLGPVVGATASVTFARWLFGSAEFGLLAPLLNTDKSASGTTQGRLLLDFSGTAGFKVPILANFLFASADYTFHLERDAFLTARTQFEHAVMVRVSVTLF